MKTRNSRKRPSRGPTIMVWAGDTSRVSATTGARGTSGRRRRRRGRRGSQSLGSLHAPAAGRADGGRVLGAGGQVEAVAGLQLDVAGAGVEHDASRHAVEDLVVRVRVPPVGV